MRNTFFFRVAWLKRRLLITFYKLFIYKLTSDISKKYVFLHLTFNYRFTYIYGIFFFIFIALIKKTINLIKIISTGTILRLIQPDQINMAVQLFLYLVKSDKQSHVLLGTRKTRPCITGHPVNYLQFSVLRQLGVKMVIHGEHNIL